MRTALSSFVRRGAIMVRRFHTKPVGVIPLTTIASFLPANPIVVEAGAHQGFDTVAMSKFWRAGQIHAFEPVPSLFQALATRTRNRANVYCYPLALSNAVGTARMHVSGGTSDASSSLLEPKEHLLDHLDVTFPKEIVVQTTTLDAWTEENGISRVDFLWLDMQGHELAALKAAPHALSGVRAIHTEVYLKESYEGVPLYAEVREFLQNEGFVVAQEELPWIDAGNVLFVREPDRSPRPASSAVN